MSRPIELSRPPATELRTGEIVAAATDGTATYVLTDQPDRVRGPSRYLRPAQPTTATTEGELAHVHNRPDPPDEGTPCLVVTVGGSFDNAWVIPFE